MSHSNTMEDDIFHLWSLIRKNNPLFSQKNRLKQFESTLDQLCQRGDFEGLIGLMTLSLYGNEPQRALIEQYAWPWLRHLNCDRIAQLDERLRSSIEYAKWSSGAILPQSQPSTVFHLCVLAAHPNGYYRERAVVAMARHPEPVTLAFALVRCNDWVLPVRSSARDTAAQLIAKLSTDELLRVWNVFARMSKGQRHRDISFVETVFPLLRKRVSSEVLHRQLQSDDSKTRRYAAELMWETHASLTYADLQALCSCSDPYICFRTLRDVLPSIDLKLRVQLLETVRKKKWAPARLERLRIIVASQAEKMRDALQSALCDRSATIRNFARFHLRDCGDLDIEAHYLAKLHAEQDSEKIAALFGLQEIGSPSLASTALDWLNGQQPRRIAAALRVLPDAWVKEHEQLILEMITDDSAQVSKAAYQTLMKNPPSSETVFPYLDQSGLSEQHTLYLSYLLFKQGRWDSVVNALVLARHPSERVREAAAHGIQRWLVDQSGYWLKPPTHELDRIESALSASAPHMSKKLTGDIESMLKIYR
ncbi:hypothetical protein JIN77_13180 [Verrucomicrobiaceae bacterium R5-34]|nr:hypothetical protein [Verrucomicrobiaceae bacterium R5-34]